MVQCGESESPITISKFRNGPRLQAITWEGYTSAKPAPTSAKPFTISAPVSCPPLFREEKSKAIVR
ncbi:hypothetical protein AXF42_Ash003133 [Apostasia shenzhenica]|uniref:Uncharacterized protein n=1 Tax=Apostasia shenzhenica TaxID=1088818 RepID=A0A2I0BFB6_9ASPA|nr:hypothetical protein AXF42_Ash003133 [Apostasia shenzhenica]